MSNKIKFSRGDVGDFYEPSDSEGEYTEHEKKLLKKVRTSKQRNTEAQQQVLAFDEHDDDDEDIEDIDDDDDGMVQNSDFDDDDDAAAGGDDGIPDERAWGKKRKDFYSTDFVDQDYSSYNVDEEQAAEQEEQEARAIQQRLAKQLNEADFTLDVFGTAAAAADDGAKATAAADSRNKIQTDLSDLNQRERLQLFRKDSPEFEGLVQDFEQRLQESANVLEPVLAYFRGGHMGTDVALPPAVEFVQTKNNLILTYCSNVAFYLVLKAKRLQIKNHPLVKRLVQMRQLLVQLEERYDKVIRPQLEVLLERIGEGKALVFQSATPAASKAVGKPAVKKVSKLKFLKDMESEAKKTKATANESDDDDDDEDDDNDDEEMPAAAAKGKQSDSDDDDDQPEDEAEDMGADEERRQITYQMSKNKGLTPFRKKELRNPRVKHRNKFRKALIRRKGAVRTVRKETKRYGGEVSGIKASTKKGIKIK